jgi:hypothetical protein
MDFVFNRSSKVIQIEVFGALKIFVFFIFSAGLGGFRKEAIFGVLFSQDGRASLKGMVS